MDLIQDLYSFRNQGSNYFALQSAHCQNCGLLQIGVSFSQIQFQAMDDGSAENSRRDHELGKYSGPRSVYCEAVAGKGAIQLQLPLAKATIVN